MEGVIDDQDYRHTSKIFQESLKKVHDGYEGRFVSIKERRAATDRTLDAGYFKGAISSIRAGEGSRTRDGSKL